MNINVWTGKKKHSKTYNTYTQFYILFGLVVLGVHCHGPVAVGVLLVIVVGGADDAGLLFYGKWRRCHVRLVVTGADKGEVTEGVLHGTRRAVHVLRPHRQERAAFRLCGRDGL